MKKMAKQSLLAVMLACFLGFVVPEAGHATPTPSPVTNLQTVQEVDAEIARLNTEKTSVEQQIQQIGQSPARANENLQEEIERKRDETRPHRRRLDAINARLAELNERRRTLTAAATATPTTPPAVSPGTSPDLVPVHDQDAPARPWQQAGGQLSPLWGHGHNPRETEKPAGVQSTNTEHETWVRADHGVLTRLTSNPGDRGWWVDARGNVRASHFMDRSTQCQPCRFMVLQFNDMMSSLLWRKAEVEQRNRRKEAVLQAERTDMQLNRTPGVSDMGFAGQVAVRINEVNAAYNLQTEALRREITRLEADVKVLATQIVECEKQCADDVPKTGLTLGGFDGWIPATTGTLNRELVFPIRWEGPYRTECEPCADIVVELNMLPYRIWRKMQEVYNARGHLASVDANVNFNNLFLGEDETPANVETVRQRIQANIAAKQRELAQVVLSFHQLKTRLTNCERQHCPDTAPDRRVGCIMPGGGAGLNNEAFANVPGSTASPVDLEPNTFIFPHVLEEDGDILTATNTFDTQLYITYCATNYPGTVSIQLEHTVPVSGTNPFDAYEIERVPDMVNNTEVNGISTFVPPVTPATPVTPTVPTVPTTPTTPTTPVTEPFSVTTSGNVTFVHSVGTSPCPQSAGSLNITSSSGAPITLSNITVSGTLSSRLNTSVANNGSTSPQVVAQFNCSSSQNGTFTGTISGTATNTSTGQTATFSSNASGSVN